MTLKELKDGTYRAICINCKLQLSYKKGGPTTHLRRHLTQICIPRRVVVAKQTRLNFQNEDSEIDPMGGPMLLEPCGKYDHLKMREAFAHWVLVNEHTLNITEEVGFNFVMKIGIPSFEKISRWTLRQDVMAVYESEKMKLKTLLKKVRRISLTTDLWKSLSQQVEYMVITGHFIHDWKLQKRILDFVEIPPPSRGIDLADAIYKCLKEWGIENKVFTISVDNAQSNDVCLRVLKETFSLNRKMVCDGKLFHVRFCAHILNLLVQDDLNQIRGIVDNVRESVKYIKHSDARLKIFAEIVQQLQLPTRKLILDCPTRWNSTYEMLSVAFKFKNVFPRFKERDPNNEYLPKPEEWDKVDKVCHVLEPFAVVTNIIFGSDYPTSNLYLLEVYRIKEVLDNASFDEEEFMRSMATKMKTKFDKYSGACNLLMAVACALDPRCKLKANEMCFPIIYHPEEKALKNISMVKDALYELFNDYVELGSKEITTTQP